MSDPTEAGAALDSHLALRLSGVEVCYRVPHDRITSFKERMLRFVKGGVSHRDLWALRAINLSVERGELLGVVGRNGAGKSTLLAIMARVLTPTAGRVEIRGRAVPLLQLGAGFHPDLSGDENMLLNGSLLGFPEEEILRRRPEVIDFAELDGFLHLPVRQYSSGMVARLGFALATLDRPDVLLVDEALAVGDIAFQEKCLARIEGFRTDGTTIILVSHQPDAIERCDRAILLEGGELVLAGNPRAVVERYVGATRSSAVVVPAAPTAAELDDAAVERLGKYLHDLHHPVGAVRFANEIRRVARRYGFDADRVVQVGANALPACLFCLAATGSSWATTTGAGPALDEVTMARLLTLLRMIGELDDTDPKSYRDRLRPGRHLDRLGADPSGSRATLALALLTIEHEEDPRSFLRALHEALEPGGGFLLQSDLLPVGLPEPLVFCRLGEDDYAAERRRRPKDWAVPGVPTEIEPHRAFANRWLRSDLEQAIADTGFEILNVEPLVRGSEDEIRRDELVPPFHARSIADLTTLRLRLAARRPR